jgi:Asp-tRNA(Asn)/Glu-tRNA(Gln) amidotransferase A subunit family amidase
MPERPVSERRVPTNEVTRRRLLKILASAGVGTVTFRRALMAMAVEEQKITSKMIDRAAWVAGLDFTKDERELMLEGVNSLVEDYAKLREVTLPNDVPPALRFEPLGYSRAVSMEPGEIHVPDTGTDRRPASEEDLAFAPLARLASMIRGGAITCTELTKLYLERLREYDTLLECVITLTEEKALRQAEQADREIGNGRYRGPLHGIPWGAKDLLAISDYRTTWGAKPYEEQILKETATVADRLDTAGSVLVAKLTLGALAWGDVWFGGKTRNPWNIEEGSSGSSAGPASATAAGLVGFAMGSETWGSIVSPCTRCGTTGLRPTFGRVSRHGAMALSWSMDKLGPIARSVEDCALIFDAIQGPDGKDTTVVDAPFRWPLEGDPRELRVGFVQSLFDEDRSADAESEDQAARIREWQEFDRASLETLRALGFRLVPIELPGNLPVSSLSFILTAEAAAAFDELTRSGRDDLLVRQVAFAWPNVFRQGQVIPAVEYIRANRIRTLLMREMEKVMADVDLYVSPSYGGDNLLMTNLTGHPAVVLPNGFRSSDGTPTSITFTGRLFGETELLSVAHAYQQATDFHLRRPPLKAASPAAAESSA